MKTIINLTPHQINVFNEEGKEILTINSSGVARCSVESVLVGEINGIPLKQNRYGEVTGLPAPAKNTLYIVSLLVAQASWDRGDLIVVDDTIRDEDGRIIGCKGFARI